MQQFSVDIFNRKMVYVCNGQTAVTSIDDDYISPNTNAIEIQKVSKEINSGYFIRLQNEKNQFFGLITNVSPGENQITIQFTSFVSIFSETMLFWTRFQGTESGHEYSLEWTIKHFIETFYIVNSDTLMNLPITVDIDPNISRTMRWSLGIRSDRDEINYTTIDLYSDLIIPALKKYGVSITVTPDFNAKLINLKVTKSKKTLNVDGNLDDVTVRTLKYNNRPLGTNKLEVVNSNDVNGTSIIYYAHPDRTFDTSNTNRITPVNYETRLVSPSEDTVASFQEAALDEAYNIFAGSSYDNLIELEAAPDNPNIRPMELEIGQRISLWYEEGIYTSILTGKIIEDHSIVLLFGSERIQYTKRAKGGR